MPENKNSLTRKKYFCKKTMTRFMTVLPLLHKFIHLTWRKVVLPCSGTPIGNNVLVPCCMQAPHHLRDNYLGEVISRAACSLLPRDIPEKQSRQVGPATAAGTQPCTQIKPSGYGSVTLGKQHPVFSFHLCRKPWDFLFSCLCFC